MGFLKNPVKAVKGAINRYVPGGKQLTGDAKKRQKRLYNEAKSNYDNYANEAQNKITQISEEIKQSAAQLQSLQYKKQQSDYKGQQLQRDTSNYAYGLNQLNSKKARLAEEANNLRTSFTEFSGKIPELQNQISEVNKLPEDFTTLFNQVKNQKESLRGLSNDEASGAIKRHLSDVDNLKAKRQDTEDRIRQQLSSIGSKHGVLLTEKEELEKRLGAYRARQEDVESSSSNLSLMEDNLKQMLSSYRGEATSINSQYEAARSKTQQLNQNLESYIKTAQSKLNELGSHLEWRAGKYRKEAQRTGLVQALGIGALTFGAGMGLSALAAPAAGTGAAAGGAAAGGAAGATGAVAAPSMASSILSGIGTGLKYASLPLGMMHYGRTANIEHKLKNPELINLADFKGDLANISSREYVTGGQKFNIPELGGLKQSLEHFNMPQVPNIRDLPTIDQALGKIVSAKDVEGLSLGLPQMTARSGKKYNSGVLYNPKFLKQLKKLSKGIAMPYLKQEKGLQTGGVAYG